MFPNIVEQIGYIDKIAMKTRMIEFHPISAISFTKEKQK
jgi:hypothetical protein